MRRALRWGLRLFPKAFRERYGNELVDLLIAKTEQTRERHGRFGVVRLWVFQFIDLTHSAFSERRVERRRSMIHRRRRRGHLMFELLQDVRFALRALSRGPGFTAVIVVTLALGIGANTAIFSVVRAVLLQPLPYPDPDRLVTLWSQEGWPYGTNVAEYFDIRNRHSTLTDIAVYRVTGHNVTTGDGGAFRVTRVSVTAGFFSILGVPPLLGRTIGEEDDAPGKAAVAVLRHGFWQQQFGGNAGIIGQTVVLDGTPVTVVGVMPSGFAFPDEVKHWGPSVGVDIWMPARVDPTNPGGRGGHGLQSVARVRAGVSLDQASQDIRGISLVLHEENPGAYPTQFRAGWTLRLEPLHDSIVGGVRSVLLVLLGAVGLVLLIAVVNVANLLLAHGTTREKEIAVRAALGASRGRIVRQLLTESIMLSLLGGIVGVSLAVLVLGWLVSLAPSNIPRLAGTGLDAGVLAFALVLSILSGILCGMAPALYGSRTDLQQSLKEGDRGSTQGRGEHLRRGLVAVEVAVTLVLLVGAGLLIKSLSNLHQVDVGFRTDNLLTYHVTLPRAKYQSPASRIGFYQQLLTRMRGLPGVQNAGAISRLPLAQDFSVAVMAEGMAPNNERFPHGLIGLTAPRAVTPDYFGTMGLALLEGRFFDDADLTDAPYVAIVSDEFARAAWTDGESVIGKRVAFPSADPQWRTVVGIVKDTREEAGNVASERYRDAYFPLEQLPAGDMYVAVKAAGDPLSLVATIRGEVASLDPTVPIYDVRTMEDVVRRAIARPHFNAWLMTILAAVALGLGGVGIYSVVSYAVGRRIREIGIRMTLGAQPRNVIGIVLMRGMQPVLIGLAVGLAGVFGLARLLRSLLFNVNPIDWQTYGAVSALLAAVALIACYVPARRAVSADPTDALRQE